MDSLDHRVRLAAFAWFSEQVGIHGEVLPRDILAQGFQFEGVRVPLVAPQGIFKPRILDIPLTITTTSEGPYDDSFDEEGCLSYRYRGTDPEHRDNRGLRAAMLKGKPLIYLHSVVPGKYLAVWPVYIVGDEPGGLTFTVVVDNQVIMPSHHGESREDRSAIRGYITGTVRRRLHQQGFRERVLQAYRNQCTLCQLRHPELLDAAHIIPDNDPKGVPVVTNGLALCKLHHAAFDRFFIGISPDYEVVVRGDVLEEDDGPMLQHGLKDMHRTKILLPRSKSQWPDQEHLEIRYQKFLGL